MASCEAVDIQAQARLRARAECRPTLQIVVYPDASQREWLHAVAAARKSPSTSSCVSIDNTLPTARYCTDVVSPVIPHPSSILARWMDGQLDSSFVAVAAEVNASLEWRCDGVARACGTRAAIALVDGCVAMLVWLDCLLRNCGTSWLQHGLDWQHFQVGAVDGGDVGLGIQLLRSARWT